MSNLTEEEKKQIQEITKQALDDISKNEWNYIKYDKNTETFNLDLLKRAKKRIKSGLLWAAGGVTLTFITYQIADNYSFGGTYFIFWGAILFGIFDLIRGFIDLINYQRKNN